MGENPYRAPQEMSAGIRPIDRNTFLGSALRGFLLGTMIGTGLALLSTLLQVVAALLYFSHFQQLPGYGNAEMLFRLPVVAMVWIAFSGTLGSISWVLITAHPHQRTVPPIVED